MKEIVPAYYRRFQCVGGKCRHSCCIGWEIDIDDNTYEYYKGIPGSFGSRLRENMDRKETHGFILSAGRCPFLNRRGLCDIQLELGEKGLCTVCREYPRFTETFPGRIEKGIGLSCEEAVRLLFSRKEPLRFEMVYTAEEQENGTEDEPVEEALFAVLLKARETSICILQDRSCSLGARMTALLRYAEQLQREINDNQWGKIRGLAPRLGQEPFESPLEGICCDDMEKILKVFASMEAMNDDWVKILEELCKYLCEGALGKAHYQARRKAFLRDILAYEYQYEHVAVYFIYRYFLKAVYDYDVLSKVKLAAVSLLIVKEMDFRSWRMCNGQFDSQERMENVRVYSEEVEHSQENLQSLTEAFLFEEVLSTEELIKLWEEEAVLYGCVSNGRNAAEDGINGQEAAFERGWG